ncbi:MAG: sugar phosphate nucleotidyltransferase [Pseudomonadota bacterium]
MKVVILAGGQGTRLRGPGTAMPKALIPVCSKPIIERVMEIYASQGFNDFLVVGGYLCDHLTEWANTFRQTSKLGCTIDVVDTGPNTDTASRLARARDHIPDETFMLTWCDGLAQVDLSTALQFHADHGCAITLTAVHPQERFGILDLEGRRVARFREKPLRTDLWVNGAFFIVQRVVLDGLASDGENWEKDVLEPLSAAGKVMAWQHHGLWMCMDTAKDRSAMEEALETGLFALEDAA